jgi:hypothetical protein
VCCSDRLAGNIDNVAIALKDEIQAVFKKEKITIDKRACFSLRGMVLMRSLHQYFVITNTVETGMLVVMNVVPNVVQKRVPQIHRTIAHDRKAVSQ